MHVLKMLIATCFMAASGAVMAQGAAGAALKVSGAYAHPPIGAGKVGVAFLKIDNASDTVFQLIGAESEAFGRIELHTHLYEDGLMKMREVDVIEVPAKGGVTLKPGGLHLMLFEPASTIKVGDELALNLTFKETEKAEPFTQNIALPVQSRSAAAGAQTKPHSAHDHHH